MTILNHVALLVRSVDDAAKKLAKYGFYIGAKEEWDGEGTAEIYVGDKDLGAKLLLMEPVKAGAYSKAMEKRGSGLHHIAIDVTDLEAFLIGLSGSGWYLHPKSILTMTKTKTAWLARPGTAMLIEVQEREDSKTPSPFINKLELPLSKQEAGMVAALGVAALYPSKDSQSWLVMGQVRMALKDLYQ